MTDYSNHSLGQLRAELSRCEDVLDNRGASPAERRLASDDASEILAAWTARYEGQDMRPPARAEHMDLLTSTSRLHRRAARRG